MEIQILENRTVRIANNNFGVIGENKAEVLEFTFPEEYQLNNKFIEFETSDGKFVDTIVDNQYPITNAITKYEELRAQIVIKDLNDNMVFKSRIFTMKFKESINATEQLDEEKKLLIDELLLEVETLQEDVENLKTDNAQNKTDISTLKTDNETNKTNISTMQERISTIQEEQTTQNTNISANTTKNAEQDSLIQKLKDNMINLQTEEATSLYVTDAGTPPAQLRIKGNHKQDGTPTLENPIEIETVKNEVNVVVSNKNMFNVPSSNLYGVEITLQEDGSYLINGTSTASWAFRVGSTIPLEPGDYTLSIECNKALNQGYFGIQNWGDFKQELSATGEKHINLTETKKVQCYFTCNLGSTFDNVVVKVQLEKSNVKTDSIKHEEIKKTLDIQQEMLKGDDFDLENSKEVHNWKKYTITNINEFTNVTKEGSTFRFIKNVTNGNQISDVICNMCKKLNNSWSETGCFISYDSKFYLMIKFGDYGFTEAMTVDEAKTHMNEFLSITSLVFYYTTSTTTQLDLTTEQKEVLAQLNNLDLFKGINNIYTEEGIALMQLDYSADTKMYIDKLVGSEG